MTNEIVVTSMHIFVQRVHIPANCMALNACDGPVAFSAQHDQSNPRHANQQFVYRIYGKENK